MPTPTQLLYAIAPIANYLASNSIANGMLYKGTLNEKLAIQIYIETQAVQYRYNAENIAGGNIPSAALIGASNYLYSILGEFGSVATNISGSGGSSGVIPIVGGRTIIYSIPQQFTYTVLVDGETVISVPLPVGAIIYQINKSILILTVGQWSYTNPTLILSGGISLSATEVLNIFYVYPL